MKNKLISLIVLITLLFGIVTPIYADTEQPSVQPYIDEIGQVLLKNNPQPKPGSIAGEWLILGLSRSDLDVPNAYYDSYYKALETTLKEKQGVLHKRKYTEYSRTVLALTAMGKDPSNTAGYDLLQPLEDKKAVVQQGINGAVFALLALDSNEYPSDMRQQYVAYILEKELPKGGWALSGDQADLDVTAMVLQALAPYRNEEPVRLAIARGVKTLSSCKIVYCESAAQILVAITSLDTEEKAQASVLDMAFDSMMQFYQPWKGFRHTVNGEVNAMATEQAFYALVATERYYNGKHTLYDMTAELNTNVANETLVEDKNKSVVQTLIKKMNELLRKGA